MITSAAIRKALLALCSPSAAITLPIFPNQNLDNLKFSSSRLPLLLHLGLLQPRQP